MEDDSVQNVPHMHLFLVLKRQFPELRDADVTDCIQRFGLNKVLCERELTQRINEQQKVYYSPWSPRRPSSRSSDASLSSSPAAMPLTNGDTLSPLGVATPDIEVNLVLPQDVDHRAAGSCGTGYGPHSAPVSVGGPSANPFAAYELPGAPRRSSAETPNDTPIAAARKRAILQKLNEHPESEDDVAASSHRSADTPISPPTSGHASNTLSSSSQYSETSRGDDVDVAVINEQLTRRSKLEEELKCRKEEQNKLQVEIQIFKEKRDGKENDQKKDIDDCKKRIENLMKENMFLLQDCGIMDKTLLEEYDDPSLAVERRDTDGISHSTEVDSPSPVTNKLSDRSHFADPSDRHTAQRSHPSGPSIAINYATRHQDRVRMTEEVECDWACCKCTFLNHAKLSHCEMCGFGNFPGVRHS